MIKFTNSKFKAFEMNAANYDEATKTALSKNEMQNLVTIFSNYNEDYEIENSSIVYGFKHGTKYVSAVLKLHKNTKYAPKQGVKLSFDVVRPYVTNVYLVTFKRGINCQHAENKKDQILIEYNEEFVKSPIFEKFEMYDYYKKSELPATTIKAVDIDISKLNF